MSARIEEAPAVTLSSLVRVVRIVVVSTSLLSTSNAAAQPATERIAAPTPSAAALPTASTHTSAGDDDRRAAAIIIEEAARARTRRFVSGTGWFALGAGGVTYGLLSRRDDNVVESAGGSALRIMSIGFYGIIAVGSVVSALLPDPIEKLAEQAHSGRVDRVKLREVADASRRGRHANGLVAITGGIGLALITGLILGSDVLTRRDRVSLAVPAAVGAGVLLIDGISRLTWERTIEEQALVRVNDGASATSLRLWGGPIARGAMLGVMTTW